MSQQDTRVVAPQEPGFWAAQLPYLVMLLLVFGGIAITSMVPRLTSIYWQVIAVVFAGTCIASEWGKYGGKSTGRWRMVRTQLLHWAVILIAMRMLFVHDVADSLSSNALGLAVLGMLAIGTLLAGIHIGAWQISLVGVLLAVGIPAIAWLEQAALLLTGVAVVVAAAAVVYVRQRNSGKFL